MNVEEVLAGLSPKLRKRLGTAAQLSTPESCPTPSIGLTRALGGGLRYGRQHMIYGNKSSGKSSLCLQMIGEEQRRGKTCAWIDVEQAYDTAWATRLGVDNGSLIVSEARTINDMVDVGVALMEAGVDLIVVDSISSLLPAIFFEKDSDKLKDLVDTKQIGAEARDMAHAVKMLNYANNRVNDTLLLLISQTRNNIGAMYASIVPTGGKAVQFYSSTIVQLFSSESEAQAITGDIYVGDKILQRKIGRKVRWDIKFSKTSPNFQSGEYDFYFDGKAVGVDVVADIVDTAESFGIIVRAGAWYTVGEERYQGRDNLIKAVRESPDLQHMLVSRLSQI